MVFDPVSFGSRSLVLDLGFGSVFHPNEGATGKVIEIFEFIGPPHALYKVQYGDGTSDDFEGDEYLQLAYESERDDNINAY